MIRKVTTRPVNNVRRRTLPLAGRSNNGNLPPISCVQIQTHSRCNADCLFCPYAESWHHDTPGVMTDELWKHTLNNLKPWADNFNSANGKIVPYLMNEPLVDRTIFDKIKDIYSYFPKTSVEISTNGAALTETIVGKLFQAFDGKRHDLWISHHGIDKESLEHIMKIPYEKAHANLIRLIKLSDGKFTIKIRGAGESKDGKHVFFTRQQYLDYWRDQFVKHELNPENISIDAFTFHDRAGTLHRTDRGACNLNIGKVRDIGPGHAPFYCPRIDQWLHIMYDGTLRLCCMDYHAEVKLPNIKDVWLPEYFLSDEYKNIVDMVTGRKESPDNFICSRCVSPGG